jgi:hypothetical protein
MKAKPKPKKKPRRVVLGVGHPWFSDGLRRIELQDRDSYEAVSQPLHIDDLGRYNKVRLVAEVLG